MIIHSIYSNDRFVSGEFKTQIDNWTIKCESSLFSSINNYNCYCDVLTIKIDKIYYLVVRFSLLYKKIIYDGISSSQRDQFWFSSSIYDSFHVATLESRILCGKY